MPVSEHKPIVVTWGDEEAQACETCFVNDVEPLEAYLWPCAIRQLEERMAVTAFGFDRERFYADRLEGIPVVRDRDNATHSFWFSVDEGLLFSLNMGLKDPASALWRDDVTNDRVSF